LKRYIANTIIIDHKTGDISIDGAILPWHIASDGPEVEVAGDSIGPINIVTLPIYTDNVIVVRKLEDELEAIREKAREIIREDVEAFSIAASKARQEAQHRHARRMIELRVEKRRREGTLMQGYPYDRRPGGREEEQYEAAIAAKERGAESFSIVRAIREGRGERL
jgi:hypothetical protein